MAHSRICSIPDCGKPKRSSAGLCNTHRIRLWRYGNAETILGKTPQRGPLSERFWAFISKNANGCWLWTGSLNNNGYGEVGGDDGEHLLAHRASWQLHFGRPPKGVGVLHKCDTPACVNPDHLFLGSQKVNMQDCKAKGRTTSGTKNAQAKLSAEDVLSIRRMAADGIPQPSIAARFKVSSPCISMIVTRRRWAHLP